MGRRVMRRGYCSSDDGGCGIRYCSVRRRRRIPDPHAVGPGRFAQFVGFGESVARDGKDCANHRRRLERRVERGCRLPLVCRSSPGVRRLADPGAAHHPGAPRLRVGAVLRGAGGRRPGAGFATHQAANRQRRAVDRRRVCDRLGRHPADGVHHRVGGLQPDGDRGRRRQ